MKLFRKQTIVAPNKQSIKHPLTILKETEGLWRMDENQRVEMTVSCKDVNYIKKHKDAGKIKKINGKDVQVMHNGMLVALGGYHGEWMSKIIKKLKGHHEPQEEKVFYEILKRIGSNATMIELGSFWSFYSIWFNMQIKNAKNLCCEPDPNNLDVGKRNAELNNIKDIEFIRSCAGSNDGEMVDIEMESDSLNKATVQTRTVDSLIKEKGWEKLDILHMDVQGFEYSALLGAVKSIKAKKIRFAFISTHHYYFSDNPNTHNECIELIKSNGGHIISAHNVLESFSGDGLIVASFYDEDKDFKVETSINHANSSLFRPYEEDLKILSNYIDNLIK